MARVVPSFKSLLVGRPKHTAGLEHERLSKPVGLAVFASDNLSSVAYATEEMLIVLIAAGTAALFYTIHITIAITLILAIIAISYRETIRAYPSGGGAYIVAYDNLGRYPGLVAASALLIDYILTVAVSISAGVAAIVSAGPSLAGHAVGLSIGIIVVVAVLNLRGLREAGKIFAVPTFAFVFFMILTIVWGLVRYFVFGYRPPAVEPIAAQSSVTFFLLMRAFSHGSTAVTGIEATANGVQAFREPAARNAAQTLINMAAILAFVFVGVSVLANLYHVTGPSEDPKRTVVALIALKVFGGGPLFLGVQASTALILVLAANTGFAGFPQLAAVLAKDRFAPRQLLNRGDRLAYSNGIVGLAALASVLVIVYEADVSRLINLYVLGVFASLTLSQAGMVKHWIENKKTEPRWRRQLTVNTVGALATTGVLTIVMFTKFTHGAWMVVLATPIIVFALNATNRHYRDIAIELRDPVRRLRTPREHQVVLLVGWPSAEERLAGRYAALLRGAAVRGVHFSAPDDPANLVEEWGRQLGGATSLEMVPIQTSLGREIRKYVTDLRAKLDPSSFLTVIVPEKLRPGLFGLAKARRTLLIKAMLLFTPGVVVTDVPYLEGQPPSALESTGRTRHVAIVLISAVHNATLRALDYGRSLETDELRVLHIGVDPEFASRVAFDWEIQGVGEPLEVLESPYRELAKPLQEYVKSLVVNGDTTVTLILPEFIVSKRRYALLHNQNAVEIKRTFLFEPNVIVTSVPTRLGSKQTARAI